ncbi:hypothetical protein SUGI_0677190 [Cryptomeria japonica]|nr:hypothetical protein SUGI_0677190 [Cryptomeria japonica]
MQKNLRECSMCSSTTEALMSKKLWLPSFTNVLKELGIRAFLDSEEKEFGISFPYTIETAVHSASDHKAIFSKRYAESTWCLAELLLMLLKP